MNVHVASWRATATALPAWSADSNTTCGHSNTVPLMHAGMSRMIFRRSSVTGVSTAAARSITISRCAGFNCPSRSSEAMNPIAAVPSEAYSWLL